MRLILAIGVVAALSLSSVATAMAGVEFGALDYGNGLSRPGVVSCDWDWGNWVRACPTPDLPPKAKPAAKAAAEKPKS